MSKKTSWFLLLTAFLFFLVIGCESVNAYPNPMSWFDGSGVDTVLLACNSGPPALANTANLFTADTDISGTGLYDSTGDVNFIRTEECTSVLTANMGSPKIQLSVTDRYDCLIDDFCDCRNGSFEPACIYNPLPDAESSVALVNGLFDAIVPAVQSTLNRKAQVNDKTVIFRFEDSVEVENPAGFGLSPG